MSKVGGTSTVYLNPSLISMVITLGYR